MRIDSGSQISYTIEYNITTVPCNVIGKKVARGVWESSWFLPANK
jgi:hypothetical protein